MKKSGARDRSKVIWEMGQGRQTHRNARGCSFSRWAPHAQENLTHSPRPQNHGLPSQVGLEQVGRPVGTCRPEASASVTVCEK